MGVGPGTGSRRRIEKTMTRFVRSSAHKAPFCLMSYPGAPRQNGPSLLSLADKEIETDAHRTHLVQCGVSCVL